MIEVHRWEVWWAYVRHEEEDVINRRPVVILDADKMVVIALKVTGTEPRNLWGEYDVVRWKTAGLTKPSTVRTTKILQLEYSMLDGKMGKLDSIDIQGIEKALML